MTAVNWFFNQYQQWIHYLNSPGGGPRLSPYPASTDTKI